MGGDDINTLDRRGTTGRGREAVTIREPVVKHVQQGKQGICEAPRKESELNKD